MCDEEHTQLTNGNMLPQYGQDPQRQQTHPSLHPFA